MVWIGRGSTASKFRSWTGTSKNMPVFTTSRPSSVGRQNTFENPSDTQIPGMISIASDIDAGRRSNPVGRER